MTKILTLLPGHRFGNYKLRENTKVSFEVSEGSVVAMLLQAGVAESGENEREAMVNLECFISDILDEHRDNPEQRLGCRLAQQMRLLDEILERK